AAAEAGALPPRRDRHRLEGRLGPSHPARRRPGPATGTACVFVVIRQHDDPALARDGEHPRRPLTPVLDGSLRLTLRAHHVPDGFDQLAPPLIIERPKVLSQFFTTDREEGLGLSDAIPAQTAFPGPKGNAVRLLRTLLKTLGGDQDSHDPVVVVQLL